MARKPTGSANTSRRGRQGQARLDAAARRYTGTATQLGASAETNRTGRIYGNVASQEAGNKSRVRPQARPFSVRSDAPTANAPKTAPRPPKRPNNGVHSRVDRGAKKRQA